MIKRYSKDRILSGNKLSTHAGVANIRRAIELNLLTTTEIFVTESKRLDHLAHEFLGDSQLWWVLAATSNIGWGLQVPPGTIIRVPNDLAKIEALLG